MFSGVRQWGQDAYGCVCVCVHVCSEMEDVGC